MKPVVLISTYALGHMPHGLVSPAAWLRAAGFSVELQDVAIRPLDWDMIDQAGVVGLFVPMHTATRLALKVLETIRTVQPDVPVVVYGLYAPLNAALFQERGVQAVLGGEYEAALVQFCQQAMGQVASSLPFISKTITERLPHRMPFRTGLPPLTEYAKFIIPNEPPRTVGYVLTTRGCKHHCRHCPVVPVYQGRFRVIPRDIVLNDITQLIEQGATHITFGDPDFFNGPGHAIPIVQEFHRRFPHVTYDVTIKIEHLLRHRKLLPILKETGCRLITSAVESVNDKVLIYLKKGHKREDFYRTVALLSEVGIPLQPTFIPFHPWTTIEEYQELLTTLAELALVPAVAPVQLAIRLLIPPGSLMLELPEIQSFITGFNAEQLSYQWENPVEGVNQLYKEVQAIVSGSSNCQSQRVAVFRRIWEAANRYANNPLPFPDPLPLPEMPPPYLSENWYCCAEPTDFQFEQV